MPGQIVLGVSAGTHVATLVRATPGVLRVSLFIDAGSRDASPPQLATIAAGLAATHGDRTLQPVVSPDLTELARDCASAELESCVRQLRTALDLRAVSDADLLRARLQLRDDRRRALAADPERQADRGALHALLGDAAAGFFPLGESAGDDASDTAAVQQFLRAHYGPSRALVVVAGDAEPERVKRAVASAFAGASAAGAARAAHALVAQSEPSVEVAVEERESVSLAILAARATTARAVVAALQEELNRSERADMTLRGNVFSVRGGALAVVRVQTASAEHGLLTSARELARLMLEPPPSAEPAPEADDLLGVSRAFAAQWSNGSAQARAGESAGFSFAAGVLVKGGRGDDPRNPDPNAAERTRASERMHDALTLALTEARPDTKGTIAELAASVVAGNGARIEVRRQHAERVAIAVRSALGAGEDPPLSHGRAALLATLTATACAGLGPERLNAELAALGATLSPRVDAESYGLLLDVPSARWREGLDLALRCQLEPSRDPVHVADALLRLQGRLGGSQSPLTLRARVAALLAPRAPGLCAPWGHPELLGNVNGAELERVLPRALTGARLSLAIFGDVPPDEAVARAARRVSRLPAGSLAQRVDAGVPVPPPPAAASSGLDSHLLVVWHAHDAALSGAGSVSAVVAAGALATALARTPGLRVLARDAGRCGDDAWSALLLRVAAEALPNLPAALTRAVGVVPAPLLAEALQRGLDEAERRTAQAGSQLDVSAERLARERLGVRAPAAASGEAARVHTNEAALRVAQALLAAAPTVLSLD